MFCTERIPVSPLFQFERVNKCYSPHIHFDGANGVGAITMEYVSKKIGDKIKVDLYNDDIKTPEKLNHCVSHRFDFESFL